MKYTNDTGRLLAIHIDNSVKLVQCIGASGTDVINIRGIDYAV